MDWLKQGFNFLSRGFHFFDETLEINYDGNHFWNSPKCNIVENLIINDRSPVLLVGEGNFTFATALAAIRGSWDGITATCLDRDGEELDFTPIKLQSIEYSISNSSTFDTGRPGFNNLTHTQGVDILNRVNRILRLRNPVPRRIIGGIDAVRHSHEFLTLANSHRVVWFQCPWPNTWYSPDTLVILITDFLENLRKFENEYVLIGITTHRRYVHCYRLQDLFHEYNPLENFPSMQLECRGYTYVGADDSFIKTILKFGYKHEGFRDIHNYILKEHITLVFRKN